MDAIKLLESQHDDVDALFAKITRARTDAQRLENFNALADLLIAHSAIEEQIFYPAVYDGELEDQLGDALREHESMKRLIVQLIDLTPDDPRWGVKLKELQDEVESHVGEEEDELFPLVRQTVDKSELDDLGEAMDELFEDLIGGEPRNDLPGGAEAPAYLS